MILWKVATQCFPTSLSATCSQKRHASPVRMEYCSILPSVRQASIAPRNGDPDELVQQHYTLTSSSHCALPERPLPLYFRRYCAVAHAMSGSARVRSEEHTSELQSLMRISY